MTLYFIDTIINFSTKDREFNPKREKNKWSKNFQLNSESSAKKKKKTNTPQLRLSPIQHSILQ